MAQKTQECRLCREDKPLRKSHIIPELMYKGLYNQHHRMLLLEKGKHANRPRKGIYERLLCSSCETQLNRYEQHVEQHIIDKIRIDGETDPNYVEINDFNYHKSKLFFLSLLWRASISSHSFFQNVDLGPYEDKLRDIVHKEIETEPSFFPICAFYIEDSPIKDVSLDNFVIPPRPQGYKNITVYRYTVKRIDFHHLARSTPSSEFMDPQLFLNRSDWTIGRINKNTYPEILDQIGDDIREVNRSKKPKGQR